MHRTSKFLVPVIALLSGVTCVAALAQMPTYKVGRTLSAEEVRSWDTSIGPEGKELPPGSATAKEGKVVWMKHCAVCHGADAKTHPALDTRPATPDHVFVLGGPGGLVQRTEFATTIWDVTNRYMPLVAKDGKLVAVEAGTQLSADEVYGTTAYLLYLEGIIKENDVMDAKSLPKVRMPHANDDMSPYKRRY